MLVLIILHWFLFFASLEEYSRVVKMTLGDYNFGLHIIIKLSTMFAYETTLFIGVKILKILKIETEKAFK